MPSPCTHAVHAAQVNRLSELHEALDTDEPGDALNYTALFSDDENMNQVRGAAALRCCMLCMHLYASARRVVASQQCRQCSDSTPAH